MLIFLFSLDARVFVLQDEQVIRTFPVKMKSMQTVISFRVVAEEKELRIGTKETVYAYDFFGREKEKKIQAKETGEEKDSRFNFLPIEVEYMLDTSFIRKIREHVGNVGSFRWALRDHGEAFAFSAELLYIATHNISEPKSRIFKFDLNGNYVGFIEIAVFIKYMALLEQEA